MKLRIGDEIQVTTGKDKGKRGKIEHVFPARAQVLVAGVNLYHKHVRETEERTKKGGVVLIAKPLSAGKVSLICTKCTQPTRIGMKVVNDKKVRFCKKCGQELDA